ncbi:hypothetical protein ACI3EY_16645 [Ornithinimicrobium sp. LYQ92]|uniref:hypothetical protein n=1 Tax=Serinicoccus sp. LYQ92 TaxID=3378798 RepID=UPI0038545AD4
MNRTTLPTSSPILTAMHPGNPHGLRYAEGDAGEAGGEGGSPTGEAPKAPALNEHGYPDATPVKDMSVDQQLAYHQHHSRKWEQRAKSREDYDDIKAERDRLKQAGMSPDEKALEDAKRAAANAARAEVTGTYASRLVAAELRAALAGKVPADKVAGQVQFLDHNKFLTESGEVDADKVSAYAAGITPSSEQWPDMGQGNRGSHAAEKGVGAGRDLFRDRNKK